MENKSFVFRFSDIEVREHEFSLLKAGKVLAVEPKAFRVLLLLLRNPQKLISKEELKSVQPAKGLDWLQWRPFVFGKIVAWSREQEPELIHGLSALAAQICAKMSETLRL